MPKFVKEQGDDEEKGEDHVGPRTEQGQGDHAGDQDAETNERRPLIDDFGRALGLGHHGTDGHLALLWSSPSLSLVLCPSSSTDCATILAHLSASMTASTESAGAPS